MNTAADELERLAADAERLRDALRDLLKLVENAHYPPPHDEVDAFAAMENARAALEGLEPEPDHFEGNIGANIAGGYSGPEAAA